MNKSGLTLSGHVRASIIAPDGKVVPLVSGRNTVSSRCADAAARMFAGDMSMRPSRIVFAYDTSSSSLTFNFSAGERNKTRDEILGSSLSAEVAPIADNPSLGVSGDEYTGNVVTFGASARSDRSMYVYGVIMEDSNGNVLAVKKFDSAVALPVGYALAVSWQITFN